MQQGKLPFHKYTQQFSKTKMLPTHTRINESHPNDIMGREIEKNIDVVIG